MDDAIPVKRTRKKMPPGYWKEYSLKRRRAMGIGPKTKMPESVAKARAKARQKIYYEETKVLHPRVKLTPEEIRRRKNEACKASRLKRLPEYLEKSARWRRENPDQVRAAKLRNRAKKKMATHPGHSRSEEMKLVRYAQGMTKFTGIVHHVDHIIPIAAGGFHHHENLQVLPRRLNLQKNRNYFFEARGYKSWRDVPERLWPEQIAGQYRAMMRVQKLFAA